MTTLPRRAAAEALGTALVVATVVGSGIMGSRLAAGNDAVALLANTVATAAGLIVYVHVFGPISGAHFNPAVTAVEAARGRLPWSHAAACVVAQIAGGIGGVLVAHGMFGLPAVTASTHVRTGGAQWLSEAVATFGLLLTIQSADRNHPRQTPYLLGLYIAAAYWFTASTSFANPAVTLARAFTDSFAGIRPVDVGGFIAAQAVGATAGWAAWRLLQPPDSP
jgi:glycerol uptake facilitator-like aquaporin